MADNTENHTLASRVDDLSFQFILASSLGTSGVAILGIGFANGAVPLAVMGTLATVGGGYLLHNGIQRLRTIKGEINALEGANENNQPSAHASAPVPAPTPVP